MNIRNTKPLKIDLPPEEALRRAMQIPPPASDPKPKQPAAKKKAAPKKAAKKK